MFSFSFLLIMFKYFFSIRNTSGYWCIILFKKVINMPQLDILIFKYENINFIFSFFVLFFLNQYYIFPTLVRNIVIRRKLITRSVDNSGNVYFSFVFLKKFSFTLLDNTVFKISVISLSQLVMDFLKNINTVLAFFCSFKIKISLYFLNLFKNKLSLILWFLIKL